MEEAVDDSSVPLELATQDQLLAELGRRYTNYVLVTEVPGDRGKEIQNNLYWWGAIATRLGLVEYARVMVVTEITEYAKGVYHKDE